MESDYYDAKEAAAALDMPLTTFYREVDAGNIPYILEPGRQRGKKFPKEAIHLHAQLQKKASKKPVHHTFTQATNADIWAAVENARRVYGEDDIIPYRKVLEWREINDEMTMSIKEDGQFVGCTTFIPLDERIANDLLHDRIRERNIPTQAIRKWAEPRLSVYIASISVVASGDISRDRERGAFLLRHTIKWAITLSHQYDIKNWYGVGATSAGQSILEALGFREVVSLEGGERKGYVQANLHNSRLINLFLEEMGDRDLLLSNHKINVTLEIANEADIPEVMEISTAIYSSPGTSLERRIEWLRKNPEYLYVVRQSEGQVIGYASIMPLELAHIRRILDETIQPGDITADQLKEFKSGQVLDIYIASLATKPGLPESVRTRCGFELVKHLMDFFIELGHRGITIRSVYSRSRTSDGIKTLARIGFTEIESTAPSPQRHFTINVEQSGLHFIKRYKEALHRALEEPKTGGLHDNSI